MKYAHYDITTKRLLGWYSDDIHVTIPEPNIPVTEETWQVAIDAGANALDVNNNLIVSYELTQAELDAIDPLVLLREERDKRLAEMDWVVVRAYSQGVAVDATVVTYMQDLRDLPTTATPTLTSTGDLDPASVTWPIKPTV